MNGFNFVKANTDKRKAASLQAPKPIPFPGRKMPKAKTNRGSFGPYIKALASGHRPPDIR